MNETVRLDVVDKDTFDALIALAEKATELLALLDDKEDDGTT